MKMICKKQQVRNNLRLERTEVIQTGALGYVLNKYSLQKDALFSIHFVVSGRFMFENPIFYVVILDATDNFYSLGLI